MLSIAAPFNKDAAIPAGEVTVRDVAGLYIYDNTLLGITLTGAQVKAYLEWSAQYFKKVAGAGPFTPDQVTNALTDTAPDGTPDYNYDIMGGLDAPLTYSIDIAQGAGSRIVGLSYAGAAVQDGDEFVVAINNYRQGGGGGFPGVTACAGGLQPAGRDPPAAHRLGDGERSDRPAELLLGRLAAHRERRNRRHPALSSASVQWPGRSAGPLHCRGSAPHRGPGEGRATMAGDTGRESSVTIEVDYAGMRVLRGMAGDQAGWVGRAADHASSRCSPAPFSSGLLALFGGAYRDAHTTMVQALDASAEAAGRTEDTIAATIRNYRELDVRSSQRMRTIESDVRQVSADYAPPSGDSPLPVPTSVKNSGDVAALPGDGVVDEMDDRGVPRHRAGPPRGDDPYPGGVGSVVDLANNTVDVVNAGGSALDALGDGAESDDFIRRHSR